MGRIAGANPLGGFFLELVNTHFDREVGLRDERVKSYVAALLTEFCEVEQLYKIRNAAGHPLDDVGEMLLESDPIYGEAPGFDREREVRKHIGDYVLFFAGMFPESLNRFRLRRHRLESMIDLMKAGKESYYVVSKFDHFEYAKVAPLFARLSHDFEMCVYGLNRVKNDLAARQHPITQRAERLLM